MARARNIKPAFFDNDELAEIPPLGRLLFIGLWTLCDFKGDLEWREKRIKAQLLPYDDCDAKKLAINLDKSGFIRFYSDGEKIYLNVVNFSKHQNPHKNEREKGSDIPEISESARQAIDLYTLQINRDKSRLKPDDSDSNRADSLKLIPDSLSPIIESPPKEAEPAIAAPKFNFKSELLSMGVEPQLVDDWLMVRKKKKASNTKTALTKVVNQAQKANLSVNDAIAYATGKDWKGFEAQWYFNDQQNSNVSVLEASANSDWTQGIEDIF